MRPSIVITIAVLLLAILGAATLQFFILAPGDTTVDEESGAAMIPTATTLDAGDEPSTFVHL
jgi:uncharacterized protein YpmB